jgi:fructose-1-phosphate kinase PfkB-like protein
VEADRLLHAVERALDRALTGTETPNRAWVACCGSLLPGLDTDFYARVGRLAQRRGARFVPDCDGAALAAAVEVADLLVPNEMEAGRLVGRVPRTPREAAAAARELLDRGPDRVVITLGAGGAVSVTAAGSWWASPVPPPELAHSLASGSAVGAGDAFLAGLLLSRGPELPEEEPALLARAVAAGTAALLSQGSDLVVPRAVEAVMPHIAVERLDE